LHFTPAIPEGIIGVGVESPLECSHSMFGEHHKQFLFKRGVGASWNVRRSGNAYA
jgi:hypothetical protein